MQFTLIQPQLSKFSLSGSLKTGPKNASPPRGPEVAGSLQAIWGPILNVKTRFRKVMNSQEKMKQNPEGNKRKWSKIKQDQNSKTAQPTSSFLGKIKLNRQMVKKLTMGWRGIIRDQAEHGWPKILCMLEKRQTLACWSSNDHAGQETKSSKLCIDTELPAFPKLHHVLFWLCPMATRCSGFDGKWLKSFKVHLLC